MADRPTDMAVAGIKRRVLVTGAAGFLGSHLVDAPLARGDEVVALDHRLRGKALGEATLGRVRAIETDICDTAAVRAAADGCSVAFHCAAMVGVAAYAGQPARTMETEEIGLRNVCAALRGVPEARVVYASSSAVYGSAGGASPLDETLDVAPNSNYGTAKRFGEVYLAAQYAEHGLRSVTLRIFNIYGPRQDRRLVIPRFIGNALAGIAIEIYGEGKQTRDFVYVSDVVTAATALSDRIDGCEIVNVASGQETSIRTLAETVRRLCGTSVPLTLRSMPDNRVGHEVERCFGGRAKLERFAGPLRVTGLDEGLARTIATVRSAPADSSRGRGA